MYCENCGTKLGEHDLFCENCGHPVTHNQVGRMEVESAESQSMSEKAKAALILVAFIAVALVVGLLYYFYFSPYSSNNDNTETTAIAVASMENATDEFASEVETTTIVETTTETTTETGDYYRVSVGYNNRLSFRAEPDENSTKLNRINDGTLLLITEIRGNWGKTTYDGESGWVCIQKDGDTYLEKL